MKITGILLFVIATVLADAPQTEILLTLSPYVNDTKPITDIPQVNEGLQREWANTLITYKYRLLRLARLGLRHYTPRPRAKSIQVTEDYKHLTQVSLPGLPYGDSKQTAISSTGSSDSPGFNRGKIGNIGQPGTSSPAHINRLTLSLPQEEATSLMLTLRYHA